jgi:hypothetical protein
MPFQIYNGSAWVDPTTIKRSDGSTWTDVQNIYRSDGTSWILAWTRVLVNIANKTVGSFASGGDSTFSTYELLNTGVARENSGGNIFNYSGEWLTSGSASAVEVRATLQSGSTPSGTLNTWLNLGTTRSWTLSRTGLGQSTCVLLIELRNAASGTVLDSATVTLDVIVDP